MFHPPHVEKRDGVLGKVYHQVSAVAGESRLVELKHFVVHQRLVVVGAMDSKVEHLTFDGFVEVILYSPAIAKIVVLGEVLSVLYFLSAY